MGFNKRIFSAKMLANYHEADRVNGIQTAVGRTDGFIFSDSLSKKVLDLWFGDKKDEARKLMDDYVLRISTEVSSDNR